MSWATMADLVLRTTIKAFKTAAVYTHASDSGHPVSVNGVFDRPHYEADPQSGAAIQSTYPSFGVRLTDLGIAPDAGDTLLLLGTTYMVVGSEVDGQGGAKLILQEST